MTTTTNDWRWRYTEKWVHERARWYNHLSDSSDKINVAFHLIFNVCFLQRSITVNNPNEIHSSMIRSSYSRTSDTSSAYSGSDVMQSSTNGEDSLMIHANETDDESEESSEVKTVDKRLLFLPYFTLALLSHSWSRSRSLDERNSRTNRWRHRCYSGFSLTFSGKFGTSGPQIDVSLSIFLSLLGLCWPNISRSTGIMQSLCLCSGGKGAYSGDEWWWTLRFVVSDYQWHYWWWNHRRTVDTNIDSWTELWLWSNIGSVLSSRDHEDACGRLSVRRRGTKRLLRHSQSSRAVHKRQYRYFPRVMSWII